MKKIICLLFLLSITNVFSQQCPKYKFHKLLKLGRGLGNATHSYCTGSDLGELPVNLFEHKLDLNQVYHADLGDGMYYYKVILALDRCSDQGDLIDDTSNINPVELSCNDLSWKYHKVITLGSTLVAAQNKVCNNNITGTQHKLNIYIDVPLILNKVYRLDIGDGNGLQYYYVKLRSYTKGDPDYEVLGSSFDDTAVSISCDSDGDGVPDHEDLCPNTYSSTSNYGCPGFPHYKPHRQSELSAPTWGNYELGYATGSNNPIFLSRFQNGFILFNRLLFKNIGDGDGVVAPIKIHFYISKDGTVSEDDFKFPTHAVYNGKLKAGETTLNPDGPRNFKLLGSSVGDKLSYGWYKLLIVVDEENYLHGRTGVYSIPLEYVNSHIGHPAKTIGESNSVKNKPYRIDIFDLNGSTIKSEKVISKDKEENIINQLPSGKYIIKTPESTKKISK